jgi:hypothetical protein
LLSMLFLASREAAESRAVRDVREQQARMVIRRHLCNVVRVKHKPKLKRR